MNNYFGDGKNTDSELFWPLMIQQEAKLQGFNCRQDGQAGALADAKPLSVVQAGKGLAYQSLEDPLQLTETTCNRRGGGGGGCLAGGASEQASNARPSENTDGRTDVHGVSPSDASVVVRKGISKGHNNSRSDPISNIERGGQL